MFFNFDLDKRRNFSSRSSPIGEAIEEFTLKNMVFWDLVFKVYLKIILISKQKLVLLTH
jgi:hypothetical protein